MIDTDLLFVLNGVLQFPDLQEREMLEEINQIDENRLLNTSIEDLCDYFEDKYKIEVPVILDDHICIDDGETKIDVSHNQRYYFPSRNGQPVYIDGSRITFHVPFEGDSGLFKIHPSTWSPMNPPRATIAGNELLINFAGRTLDEKSIKNQFLKRLNEIKTNLSQLEQDFKAHNDSVRIKAKSRIEERKQRILRTKDLAASLGYKMKKRADAPQTYIVPIKRRKPKITMPSSSTKPFTPEPELEMQEYESILKIITNMVSVIERSPKSFKNMKEEDLRQHFLLQLNGQYAGQATAETFNFGGKTDILLRVKDKNIFIAECKFWRGAKSFVETIDQLLGYVQWRDSKTAILLFNRQKNLSDVLKQIPTLVKEHPNFKREVEYSSETGFHYVLHHNDDRNREIYLTILVFEVPTKDQ